VSERPRRASLCSMDLIEGARILAARIANATPAEDPEAKQWSPHALPARDARCISCGGEMAEVLVVLGSLRCHDCRDTTELPASNGAHDGELRSDEVAVPPELDQL
jgi:hypothetical protein